MAKIEEDPCEENKDEDVVMAEEEKKEEVQSQPSLQEAAHDAPEGKNGESKGFFGSLKKMFTFGGSKKDGASEELDHDEYLARNNSCSSMDEDDLEGGLNLSDEEGEQARDKFKAVNKRQRMAMP